MPYLAPGNKKAMDAGVAPVTAGELTYCLTKQIQRYLRQGPLEYGRLAVVLGALEGCRLDFEDRVVLPYERDKRKENGDVWHS